MACETCRMQSRALLQAAVRARASKALARPTASFVHDFGAVRTQPVRKFSNTSSRKFLGRVRETYMVVGSTERMAKECMAPADYSISKQQRKNNEVEVLEDGEEVGRPVEPGNIWHTSMSSPLAASPHRCHPHQVLTCRSPAAFKLKPSFSTWSHVSMLHMYLLNTRIRCFDRDQYRNWHQQLIDHFFFECEKKMHVEHNITSSALRQRYLKDVFTQFRGLLLAYDEGLVKGDAVLASALWRNLFKGDPDVDARALATLVSWVRAVTARLEDLSDVEFPQEAAGILLKPVRWHWKFVTGEGQQPREAAADGAKRPAALEMGTQQPAAPKGA